MTSKQQKYARKTAQRWVFAHSSSLTKQIAAVLAAFGNDQFVQLQRCKLLKTKRFLANLHLVSEQIDSYHFDPVYESMT